VIAHRGASKAERENTLAAFRRARELGATWVELDVRLLADGHLAVHHDAVLADGRPLASLTAGALPDHVPLLEAALDACGGLGVNIEIKNQRGEPGYRDDRRASDVLVTAIERRGGADRVLVSSFDLASIDRVRALDPSIRTSWLVVAVDAAVLDRLVAHGHRVVHPFHATVTPQVMAACRERGVGVNVWTVDRPEDMRALVALGVDGICTNVPDVAAAVLAGNG
jgi:glycerophosphoryl diester phosphodiesterase